MHPNLTAIIYTLFSNNSDHFEMTDIDRDNNTVQLNHIEKAQEIIEWENWNIG